MISVEEAIVVEGKYDQIKVSSVVKAMVIKTDGFRIFKDRQKLNLIRKIAEDKGIIVLTDSDAAGFLIRNYIKGAVTKGTVRHAYIPDIFGKEKRKRLYSKEGKMGVEGVEDRIILSAIQNCSTKIKNSVSGLKIGAVDLYNAGLVGHKCSKQLRKNLLVALELPEYFSTNNLIDFLNFAIMDKKYYNILKKYNLTK